MLDEKVIDAATRFMHEAGLPGLTILAVIIGFGVLYKLVPPLTRFIEAQTAATKANAQHLAATKKDTEHLRQELPNVCKAPGMVCRFIPPKPEGHDEKR